MRTLLVLLLATGPSWAQLKEYKPSRLNFFSKEQDIQLGKESAAEVRKTMPVVNNAELTNYVNRIGQRLAMQRLGAPAPREHPSIVAHRFLADLDRKIGERRMHIAPRLDALLGNDDQGPPISEAEALQLALMNV